MKPTENKEELPKVDVRDFLLKINEQSPMDAAILIRGFKQQQYQIDHLSAVNEKLKDALEKTLASLVAYKRYTPEPYKQNTIYIMGSIEAEQAAVEALKLADEMEEK